MAVQQLGQLPLHPSNYVLGNRHRSQQRQAHAVQYPSRQQKCNHITLPQWLIVAMLQL